MGSNFELGRADIALRNAGQNFNNQMQGFGMMNQNIGMGAQLARQGYMDPIQLQQQLFQQNQLQPFMQLQGLTNPQDMMGMVAGGQNAGMDRRERQNVGGNFGGLPQYTTDLSSAIKNKGNPGTGGGTYP